MKARQVLRLLGEAIGAPVGLVVSLGLVDALRALPGPGLALALPLRETGHEDQAPFVVVAAVFALVFGLAALALGPPRPRTALLRAAWLLACALTLQAISLQLVRQASLGLDWRGAAGSAAPYVFALAALIGGAAAGRRESSDRRSRAGPQEGLVEGGSPALQAGKISR